MRTIWRCSKPLQRPHLGCDRVTHARRQGPQWRVEREQTRCFGPNSLALVHLQQGPPPAVEAVIAEAATTVLIIALYSPPHPPRPPPPPPPPPPPRPSGAATIAGGTIAARSKHVHSQRGRLPRHWFLCFRSRSSLEYSSRRGLRIAHSKSRRSYRPPRNGPKRRLLRHRAKRPALGRA